MNIYVGRLPINATEESLRAMFEVYGPVSSVKLIKDKFTGNPRGFGFVEMASAEQGQEAIAQLNGKEVDGSRITVNEARPQEPREGGRRFGGDRNGGGSRGGFGGNRSSGGGFGGSRGGDRGGSRW